LIAVPTDIYLPAFEKKTVRAAAAVTGVETRELTFPAISEAVGHVRAERLASGEL